MTKRHSKPELSKRQWHSQRQPVGQPLEKVPPPPDWLPELAHDWFRILCESAVRARTVSEADIPSLALAALTWSALAAATAALKAGEPTAARDVANLSGKLAQQLAQLGLTPRGRQLLPPAESEEEPAGPFAVLARSTTR